MVVADLPACAQENCELREVCNSSLLVWQSWRSFTGRVKDAIPHFVKCGMFRQAAIVRVKNCNCVNR
jgi:hypothetical protein